MFFTLWVTDELTITANCVKFGRVQSLNLITFSTNIGNDHQMNSSSEIEPNFVFKRKMTRNKSNIMGQTNKCIFVNKCQYYIDHMISNLNRQTREIEIFHLNVFKSSCAIIEPSYTCSFEKY